jgi:hypothetical protein
MTTQDGHPLLQNPASDRPPPRLCNGSEPLHEPSAQWAVALLRAAGPYQPAAGRQERVWANLQARPRANRARRLRLAFATTSLLVAGLFASAALARWPGWLARVLHVAPTDGATGSPARAAMPQDEAPRPMSPPSVTQPAATPAAPAAVAPSALNGSAHARRPSKTDSPEDSEILLDAMRALRVEHNPARARAVVSTYLAHHPKGALAEEALVMLVEAAVAQGDSDAPALGARYFASYPRGGFADQVRRALASQPGGTK